MQKILIYALIGLLNVMLVSSGWAAGSDDSDSSASEASIKNHADYVAAQKAIQSKDYQKAIALLKKVDQAFAENADVLNLLGYSYRKIGDFPVSLKYYQRALKVNPNHRGANEYLGELYLQTGKLAKAQERLAVLDKECIFGCDEYDQLKEAIENYRKK